MVTAESCYQERDLKMVNSLIGRKVVDIRKAGDGTYGFELDNGQVFYLELAENEAVESHGVVE